MSLEAKIKELELQLELKKAFLSARVSFGSGNKFSEEVKQTVTNFLRDAAAKAAEGQTPEAQDRSTLFTDPEIAVLKQLAANVLAKTGTKVEPTAPAEPQTAMGSAVSKAIKNIKDQTVRAQILTMDNVDRSLRGRVDALSIVRVVSKMDNGTYYVSDERGNQFHIPGEDLDFGYKNQ